MTGTIKRTHFMRLRDGFNACGVIGTHTLTEIPPDPDRIIDRVSHIPWNWIRKELYDAHILPERIVRQKMRLFDFRDNTQNVGYCIIVEPDLDIQRSFLGAVRPQRPAEIENIALFPGHEGQGRGRSFVNLMMDRLFTDGHDLVYLNTSESNYPTLPQFYTRIGMTNLGQDTVPDFNSRKMELGMALTA